MKSDYLIVHKKVLPDYFEKVVEAREMLRARHDPRGERGGAHGGHFTQHILQIQGLCVYAIGGERLQKGGRLADSEP